MNELVDASSAAVGQVVGTFATFPLDVIKTKLQALKVGEKAKSSFQVLREENLLRMYLSKFPTKALQQGSSRFTYYFIYSFVRRVFRRMLRRKELGTLMNLLVGYLAGLINVVFLCPMERVSTRVMVGGREEKSPTSSVSIVRSIYEREGIYGFYAGWTSTFYTATNPAIQNTVYDQIRNALLGGRSKLGNVESFVLGAISKMAATFVTYPVVRSKTLMNASDESEEKSVIEVTLDVYRNEGASGLYRGIRPTLAKGIFQSAFMLMVREQVDHATRRAFGMDRR
jgi:hypothetical protein